MFAVLLTRSPWALPKCLSPFPLWLIWNAPLQSPGAAGWSLSPGQCQSPLGRCSADLREERKTEQKLHGWYICPVSCWAPSAAALEMQKVSVYFGGGKDKMSLFLGYHCFSVCDNCFVCVAFRKMCSLLWKLKELFPPDTNAPSPEQREKPGFGGAAPLSYRYWKDERGPGALDGLGRDKMNNVRTFLMEIGPTGLSQGFSHPQTPQVSGSR